MTPRQAICEHLSLVCSSELYVVRNGRLDRGQQLPAATITGVSGEMDRDQSGYSDLASQRLQIDVWASRAGEAEFVGELARDRLLDVALWRRMKLLEVVAVELHDAILQFEPPEDGGDSPLWRYLIDVTISYEDRFRINL